MYVSGKYIIDRATGVKYDRAKYTLSNKGELRLRVRRVPEFGKARNTGLTLWDRSIAYFLERPDDNPYEVMKKLGAKSVARVQSARRQARKQLQAKGLWNGDLGPDRTRKERSTKTPKTTPVIDEHVRDLFDGLQVVEPEVTKPEAVEAPKPITTNNVMDTQVGGSHYTSMPVQPWEVIDSWVQEQRVGYYRGTAVAYLMRMGTKGDALEDAEKARHVLDKMISILRGESE